VTAGPAVWNCDRFPDEPQPLRKTCFARKLMAIPTKCKCGFSFSAKDALQGKRVKCPRCQGVLQIPQKTAVGAATATTPQVNKKLLDLLDDVGVRATPKGPICAACGAEMDPTAVICIDCGYNVATGQYLETYTDDEVADQLAHAEMSDAEKAIARAEREIDENPIGAEEQDFGDGADAYIVAMAGFAIFGVLVLLGLGTVLVMETLTDDVNTGLISALAGSVIYAGCGIWLTMIAFRSQVGQGLGCLLSGGLYCPIYGFLRGSGTIAVAVIMIVAFVIAAASWFYCMQTGVFG
jgi:hypothetical protein